MATTVDRRKDAYKYGELVAILRKFKIRNRAQYEKFRKTNKIHGSKMPFRYQAFYKEFESETKFFGTEKYSVGKIVELCKENNIKTFAEYRKFRASSEEHGFYMPFEPKLTYDEWQTWEQFYNTYVNV